MKTKESHVWIEASTQNLVYKVGKACEKAWIQKMYDRQKYLLERIDDIIFGGNDDESDKFVEEMKKEFEMSMIGEMKYFLGLQIVQDRRNFYFLD